MIRESEGWCDKEENNGMTEQLSSQDVLSVGDAKKRVVELNEVQDMHILVEKRGDADVGEPELDSFILCV